MPAVLFSVLALALQFISTESHAAQSLHLSSHDECDRLSRHYFQSAQEMMHSLSRCKPSTTSIEYHLSTCTWLKNNANGGEAWQSLGIAIRQAQEIDLHKIHEDEIHGDGFSVEESLLRIWDCEHRKRLWARLFIMDAHMAMALGRPRTIHREDCSAPPPLDCDYPSQPAQTVPRSTQHAYEPPNTFTPILFWISLSHKIHDMLSLQASKAHLRDNSLIQSIHDETITLLDELPSTLRPSFPDTTWDQQLPHLPALRQRILTTANTFLLALHRPYIPTHPASRHAAIEAAFAILQTQRRLFEIVVEPQRKLYGYSFYTLDAGAFLTTATLKYPDPGGLPSSRTLHELRLAATRLSLMKGRNPVAAKGEPILQQCCRILESKVRSSSSVASNEGVVGGVLADDLTMFLENLGSVPPLDEATWDLLGTLGDDAAMLGDIMGTESFDHASETSGLQSVNSSFLTDGRPFL